MVSMGINLNTNPAAPPHQGGVARSPKINRGSIY
nr:MAG TPA: hypothetical protein [Caudoviricetes sp.]